MAQGGVPGQPTGASNVQYKQQQLSKYVSSVLNEGAARAAGVKRTSLLWVAGGRFKTAATNSCHQGAIQVGW